MLDGKMQWQRDSNLRHENKILVCYRLRYGGSTYTEYFYNCVHMVYSGLATDKKRLRLFEV